MPAVASSSQPWPGPETRESSSPAQPGLGQSPDRLGQLLQKVAPRLLWFEGDTCSLENCADSGPGLLLSQVSIPVLCQVAIGDAPQSPPRLAAPHTASRLSLWMVARRGWDWVCGSGFGVSEALADIHLSISKLWGEAVGGTQEQRQSLRVPGEDLRD